MSSIEKTATVLLCFLSSLSASAQDASHDGIKESNFGAGEAKVRAEVALSSFMSIKLGPGAVNKNGDGADLIPLNLSSVEDYTKKPGVNLRVNKQLEVFALGVGYSVNASVKASDERIFQIFRFGLGTTEYFAHSRASKTMTGLYRGVPEGSTWLDASYAMDVVDEKNIQVFNALIGKDGKKSYTIGITYTIAPN